jgi:hypothetical protein
MSHILYIQCVHDEDLFNICSGPKICKAHLFAGGKNLSHRRRHIFLLVTFHFVTFLQCNALYLHILQCPVQVYSALS